MTAFPTNPLTTGLREPQVSVCAECTHYEGFGKVKCPIRCSAWTVIDVINPREKSQQDRSERDSMQVKCVRITKRGNALVYFYHVEGKQNTGSCSSHVWVTGFHHTAMNRTFPKCCCQRAHPHTIPTDRQADRPTHRLYASIKNITSSDESFHITQSCYFNLATESEKCSSFLKKLYFHSEIILKGSLDAISSFAFSLECYKLMVHR